MCVRARWPSRCSGVIPSPRRGVPSPRDAGRPLVRHRGAADRAFVTRAPLPSDPRSGLRLFEIGTFRGMTAVTRRPMPRRMPCFTRSSSTFTQCRGHSGARPESLAMSDACCVAHDPNDGAGWPHDQTSDGRSAHDASAPFGVCVRKPLSTSDSSTASHTSSGMDRRYPQFARRQFEIRHLEGAPCVSASLRPVCG